MAYTVQEVANLSGVTIKTLYHYQKVGLLMPESIGDNGYRYYNDKELERLQQILFYRELDFSLEQIKLALVNEPSRLRCLIEQENLLNSRKQRLDVLLKTLEETISHTQKGVPMTTEKMFKGLNQSEWEQAITEQNNYLQNVYEFKFDTKNVDAEKMNKQAAEAVDFMTFMGTALRNGVSIEDGSVIDAVKKHIAFLAKNMTLDASGFAAQCRFFLKDEFHRGMMEKQQVGLSYFICFAAENLATKID